MKPAYLINLYQIPYSEALILQKRLHRMHIEGVIPDTLILMEHPPVLTIGRSGGWQHIKALPEELSKQDIAVFETDRGGSVTFHGPGQLVAYPIFNLSLCGSDLLRYLRILEEVVIKLLACYGIKGRRFSPHTGVWIGNQKIAAIGVSCRRSVCMHGLALNVNVDLNYFSLINPCGICNYGVTSMAEKLDYTLPMDQIRMELGELFSAIFHLSFHDMPSVMMGQI